MFNVVVQNHMQQCKSRKSTDCVASSSKQAAGLANWQPRFGFSSWFAFGWVGCGFPFVMT
jgi:hypothetical protein